MNVTGNDTENRQKPELQGRKSHSCAFSCPASLYGTSIVLCRGECQDKMLNFRGVGNFVEQAQKQLRICDRMTGQNGTKTGSRRKVCQTRTQKRTTLQQFQKVSGRGSGGAGKGTALRNAGKRRREHLPAKQKSLQTHAARLQALEAAVTPAPHPDPEFYRTGQRR